MSQPISQHDAQGSALGPPRFTLRGLMLAITALGCLFGLMTAIGVFWSAILLFFLILISAHVLGNALGTTLRDRSSRQAMCEALGESPSAEPGRSPPESPTNRSNRSITMKL